MKQPAARPGEMGVDHEKPLFAQGELIDDAYEIRGLLGQGGMGEVYEAYDRVLNRRVALKVTRPNISAEYLLLEGRALAAIHHPGIVTVHSMGKHRGLGFLVLERVQGLSLDRMIDDRRARGELFGVRESLDLLIAVADALAVVHKAGLAHRDVKPGNIMLAPGGRVVLMDFGLVLPHADRAGHRRVAGSVQYMAPEALTGDVEAGAADLGDVYALGVLGFELLTGIIPFSDGEPADVYRAKVKAPRPRVTDYRNDVPQPLLDLIAQMMSPDAEDRPQGAETLLWQLRGVRTRSVSMRPGAPAFHVLVVDDDADMRDALALYVRAAAPDADVELLGNGAEGVQAVRRRVPDLLLLDLDLPDMNGVEVCMILRGMDLGDGCMIVSITARATRADVELLEQLGVRTLEKGPHLMEELVGIIRRMRPQPSRPGHR
jgi:serine/threonine-protein kinase